MPRLIDTLLKRLNARHFFMVSGLLFALAILISTALFVRYERNEALVAEAEHGRLYASALESHVSEALLAIDNAITVLGQAVEREPPAADSSLNAMIEGVLHNSTRLRSMSIIDAAGTVLYSSNPRLPGRHLDLPALGFDADLADRIEPGRAQFVRDLHELAPGSATAPRAGDPYIIPFARAMHLHGTAVTVLAALNPDALFPVYRAALGTEVSYAALFDYKGNVLAATPQSQFAIGQPYPALPIFAQLQRDIEHGEFRSSAQISGKQSADYLVNFQSARKFPLVAVVGMSEAHALERWSSSSGNLTWIGLIAAIVVLVYTAVLWRVMRHRENVEVELQVAKVVAEQANAARGAFLSTMSHEIRTPMNAVIGMAGLLRETPLDAQQEEFTKAVEESANALMAIIDEILDFSRIDAGKMTIEAIDCHLLTVVEGSADVLAAKAREKGVRLLCYVEPGLPVTVSVDAGRLRQVLLNLIGNAVKFTPKGEVRVRVRAMGSHRGICNVRFDVADTGIGIAPETIDRLFTPFTQADGSVTRKYGGTGLGLSICKRLVELMGGRIGVDSAVGAGSTFWFELPMAIVSAAAPVPNPQERANTHVVLVEPHRIQAAILRDYIRAWGMQVQVVGTAAEALALRLPAGPAIKQVFLIDSELPDMPASALQAALAAQTPALRFVLLAGDDDAREDARDHGFHAALMQPVRQSSLFDALSDALERRQASVTVAHDRRAGPAVVDAVQARKENRLILLVEDNFMNQKLAIHQLSLMGYAADIANNGQEALDALATVPYGLVLMDCQMPVMDGFEATRLIRQNEQAGGGHIQIVAMTANAMQGDRERCLEAGMDDYLSKPIRREQLAALLEQRLGAGKMASEAGDPAQGSSGAMPDSGASASAPLMLDMRRLHDMFDDDVEAQRGMLDLFISTTPPIFQLLGSAIAGSDFAQVKALGHRLVGSTATLGMDELAGMARAVERAGHASDLPRLKQLHEAMLTAFARLCDLVNRMKETP